MSKKKDKVKLVRYLTPERAKFLGLGEVSDEAVQKEMDREWKPDGPVFVDCGQFYAYNPHRADFLQGHRHYYDASNKDVAAVILAVLTKMATTSGVGDEVLNEWVRHQLERWAKEKKWQSLDS
jgi:hypothetical protein